MKREMCARDRCDSVIVDFVASRRLLHPLVKSLVFRLHLYALTLQANQVIFICFSCCQNLSQGMKLSRLALLSLLFHVSTQTIH